MFVYWGANDPQSSFHSVLFYSKRPASKFSLSHLILVYHWNLCQLYLSDCLALCSYYFFQDIFVEIFFTSYVLFSLSLEFLQILLDVFYNLSFNLPDISSLSFLWHQTLQSIFLLLELTLFFLGSYVC